MSARTNDTLAVLRRAGLLQLGVEPELTALCGGVSSDIWRVDLDGERYCVKRALAKLKVAVDWRAPIERSRYEAAWMTVAGRLVPDAVPTLLFDDEIGHALVMRFLDRDIYRSWKELLLAGRGDCQMAAEVADRLVRIHAGTAGDPAIQARFASDRIFHAIRLEPYLLATAERNSDVARVLKSLAEATAGTKKALVHGDVSPKNILIGPVGPVFLDAECAWYGDPAFDLAFCLNHLLLKAACFKSWRQSYLSDYEAMVTTYLKAVDWEPPSDLEARTARLLPALTLGRIDGRSPVEYLKDNTTKDVIRRMAKVLLAARIDRLMSIHGTWREAFGR